MLPTKLIGCVATIQAGLLWVTLRLGPNPACTASQLDDSFLPYTSPGLQAVTAMAGNHTKTQLRVMMTKVVGWARPLQGQNMLGQQTWESSGTKLCPGYTLAGWLPWR